MCNPGRDINLVGVSPEYRPKCRLFLLNQHVRDLRDLDFVQ
jgi:hypothetical protein